MPKAARTNSTAPRRIRSTTPLQVEGKQVEGHTITGPASVTEAISVLWRRYYALIDRVSLARRLGKSSEIDAREVEADRVMRQINALEALGVTLSPKTLADAAGHLLIIHGEIYGAASELGDAMEKRIHGLLAESVRSLAVVAAAGGFDLESAGEWFFTPHEQVLASGKVPA